MPESTDTIAQSDASERRQFQQLYELTAYVDYAKHDMSHLSSGAEYQLGWRVSFTQRCSKKWEPSSIS